MGDFRAIVVFIGQRLRYKRSSSPGRGSDNREAARLRARQFSQKFNSEGILNNDNVNVSTHSCGEPFSQ